VDDFKPAAISRGRTSLLLSKAFWDTGARYASEDKNLVYLVNLSKIQHNSLSVTKEGIS
jgi:hypothetical protein